MTTEPNRSVTFTVTGPSGQPVTIEVSNFEYAVSVIANAFADAIARAVAGGLAKKALAS